MPTRPDVQYAGYNPSPSGVPEVATPNDYLSVHANPEAFGGQIGGALQGAGKELSQAGNQAVDVATEFAKTATQTRAENDFANSYSKAAGDLRTKFDQLDYADKAAGSVEYINGLHQLGQQFTGDDSNNNPYYKQIMSQLIGRHIFSETTGIDREVVDATEKASAQAKDNMMAANNGYAAKNYNNPEVVNQMASSNYGLQSIKHYEAGHDPTDPVTDSLIQQAHNNVTADMADGMVKQAVATGDVATAMRIRAAYSSVIPGYKQLQLDNFLNIASMRQTGQNGVTSLANGRPIPETVGAVPSQVQSIVANTAHANGIDPNEALTVARIESSYGENVGSRGTIGQDKGSAGQPLDAQAQALCDNWKTAKASAETTLGRTPEGWESYTVYQQGAGGGVALLKAAQTNPNAKAADVLGSYYKTPQLALDAITKNGGNASMSVSDFLAQEKQRYNDSYERAKCDFPTDKLPGDAIQDAHTTPGSTVQPGANPVEDNRNWQRANILNLQQINAMPASQARDYLLQENERQTKIHEAQAQAYKNDLMSQAYKIMADPKITSMSQVDPNLASAVFENNPQGYIALENRIKENAGKADPSQKEALEKGPAFHELNVGTEEGASNKTTPEMINQAYNDGQINSTAQDYLLSKTVGKKSLDPNEETYKKNALEVAKSRIDPAGNIDSDGLAHYSDFSRAFDNYVSTEKAANKPLNEIYDSKNYDALIKSFEPDYTSSLPQPTKETTIGSWLHNLFSSSDKTQTPAPPKKEDLIVGQTYDSQKYGKLYWTGTGFIKPPQGTQ